MLTTDDVPALERFFARHPYTTLLLESNFREAGLADEGRPYQGAWAAAFDGDEIEAVAAHFWNGRLVLECPARLAAVARLAVARSGRPLTGILGPRAQVTAARTALGAGERAPSVDGDEDLFTLPLSRMCVPDALATGRVCCRVPRDDELALLTRWRVDYAIESLGANDGAELRASVAEEIEIRHLGALHWLLEADGEPVATSAFIARTPRCVQVGGVWTPRALRGRGHARCVVAGSLLAARDAGVRDAVLFTGRDNAPARAAYRALGFEPVGDYGMTLF